MAKLQKIDTALYDRKGPQWWSEHRGFCGHCGEPTNYSTLCLDCKAQGHIETTNPDARPCRACDDKETA